jgi:glycosyltransferase involved in cell wall biosynthesis
MVAVFWTCLIGSIYSYVLYPLLLMLIPSRRATPSLAVNERPLVTLVIACRNERSRIRQKIENSLSLSYKPLEVLVASDASDDGCDQIVEEYVDKGVRLIRSPERRGKENAQGLAVKAAKGDIVVFSDAGTDIPADSVDHIVNNFSDPRIGAVSSEDTFISNDGRVVGEGAYVKYEMWLRRLESRRSGLVGMSGSFFAIRRQVADRWDATIPSDFACALNTVRLGLVAVSDAAVRGIYKDIKDSSKEYSRKVRTAIRGMSAVATLNEVLNPFKYGLFSFEVWSHKVMRWLVPWFLAGTLLSALALSSHSFFRIALLVQLAGYCLLLCAHWSAALRSIMPIRIAYFFVQANLALAQAGAQFITGKRIVLWEPSVR